MSPPTSSSAGKRRLDPVFLFTAAALLLTGLLALWLVAGVADSPSEMQLFIGRLHPLIVHLPIGFILLTLVLEALARTRRFVRVRHAVPLALVMSALSAIAAVTAGYLLAESGGYAGELVGWHEQLGIAVAVGATVTAALHWLAARRRERAPRLAYGAALAATVGLVVATGHLGGTLTRGPDYLTEYMPEPLLVLASLLPAEEAKETAGFTYPDEAIIYEHLVAPVLEARCVSCHGPEKQKGDLRLDSPEAITAGGTSGPVIVPGRAAESRMIRRIWLPPAHEEIMPPRGRQPLSAAEAELLRWWVDQGASFEAVVGRQTPPPGVLAILEQVAGPPEERVPALLRTEVPPADSSALETARLAGVALRPIAAGSAFLRASCVSTAESCGATQLQTLLPLADQLVELDLSSSDVSDADLQVIGRLRHLTRLSVDGTGVTDAGLVHLESLAHLEYLNLYGTEVSDAGLQALAGLSNLRSLYLWQTGATPEGAERLSEQLPRLAITLGMTPEEIDSLQP